MCLLETLLFPEVQGVQDGSSGMPRQDGTLFLRAQHTCWRMGAAAFSQSQPSSGVLVFLTPVTHYSAFRLRFSWQGRLPSIHLHLWLITVIDTTLFPSLNLLTSKCSSHRLSTLINLIA